MSFLLTLNTFHKYLYCVYSSQKKEYTLKVSNRNTKNG